MTSTVRLTDLAHGGGCGCKLAPSVLSEILSKMPAAAEFRHLLVGTETADDAAVFQINDRQAIVATTDFFMPVVDDPFDFGRIAATNALSDVYAMGGTPIFALAIAGMPVGKLPIEMIQQILAGGASICAEAQIPVAGGHSIDSVEPIYGLVAIGLVDPVKLMRNSTAQAGDRLILTKSLGVGIYSAALKRQQLDQTLYSEMLASTTQLNAVGAEMPDIEGVHAVTDVTGFGLLGHTLEMCRAASIGVEIEFERVPLLTGARRFAESGIGTGAAKRNWASYGDEVDFPQTAPDWHRSILGDPQTSGGLLIACASGAEPLVLDLLARRNFSHASVVGTFTPGPARVRVVNQSQEPTA
jgi:selenide,water dikinase